jgi:hypothetical protein
MIILIFLFFNNIFNIKINRIHKHYKFIITDNIKNSINSFIPLNEVSPKNIPNKNSSTSFVKSNIKNLITSPNNMMPQNKHTRTVPNLNLKNFSKMILETNSFSIKEPNSKPISPTSSFIIRSNHYDKYKNDNNTSDIIHIKKNSGQMSTSRTIKNNQYNKQSINLDYYKEFDPYKNQAIKNSVIHSI